MPLKGGLEGTAWCPGETRTQASSRRQVLIVGFRAYGLLTFLLTFAGAGVVLVLVSICCDDAA